MLLSVLLPYEIVNAEGIERPFRKGSYLVCPNGKALRISSMDELYMGHFGGNFNQYEDREFVRSNFDLLNPPFKKRDWIPTFQFKGYKKLWDHYLVDDRYWISSEVIIGKESKFYTRDQKYAIKERLLKGVEKPTSYKNIQIIYKNDTVKGIYGDWNGYWLYKHRNIEGKELWIQRPYNGYQFFLKRHTGQKIKGYMGGALSFLYCLNDEIVIRRVEEIIINERQIVDEFNQEIKLPPIFWIKEIRIKAQLLKKKKTFEF